MDRSKAGSKHQLATDANGNPLVTRLTGANVPDVTQLIPVVDAIPPIGGKVGAPVRKPGRVMTDRGYDSEANRMRLSARAIAEQIARRNTPHGSGLGVYRWYVEQSLVLMHQFKRLRIRDDRDDQVHEAFMTLACAIMCWRRLHSSESFF